MLPTRHPKTGKRLTNAPQYGQAVRHVMYAFMCIQIHVYMHAAYTSPQDRKETHKCASVWASGETCDVCIDVCINTCVYACMTLHGCRVMPTKKVRRNQDRKETHKCASVWTSGETCDVCIYVYTHTSVYIHTCASVSQAARLICMHVCVYKADCV